MEGIIYNPLRQLSKQEQQKTLHDLNDKKLFFITTLLFYYCM